MTRTDEGTRLGRAAATALLVSALALVWTPAAEAQSLTPEDPAADLRTGNAVAVSDLDRLQADVDALLRRIGEPAVDAGTAFSDGGAGVRGRRGFAIEVTPGEDVVPGEDATPFRFLGVIDFSERSATFLPDLSARRVEGALTGSYGGFSVSLGGSASEADGLEGEDGWSWQVGGGYQTSLSDMGLTSLNLDYEQRFGSDDTGSPGRSVSGLLLQDLDLIGTQAYLGVRWLDADAVADDGTTTDGSVTAVIGARIRF